MTIESIAAGGDGVGRLADGMTVFVPRSAPGDVVEIEIIERKGRWCRGRLTAVEQPGPDRTPPRCAHYVADRCGGCQLQHLSDESQRAVKGRIVGDALRRIGGLHLEDPDVVASASPWRYRTKITLRAPTGRNGRDGEPGIGLHAFDDPGQVFPPDDCPITRESVMSLWQSIRRAGFPPDIEALVVREDRRGQRHAVIVSDPPCRMGNLPEKVADPTVSWWWKPVRGAARVVSGPRRAYPALAFEQSNAELAAEIRRQAVDALGPVEARTVWDLYGGVGDTARVLARAGAFVWSVDVDRRAHEWARTVSAGDASGAVTYVTGRVESVLSRLPTPDAVIANPPRTGLAAATAGRLAAWGGEAPGTAKLAYVSCDPATLARDFRRLTTFRLSSLHAFDLFPQTSHVEVLVVLEPAA